MQKNSNVVFTCWKCFQFSSQDSIRII